MKLLLRGVAAIFGVGLVALPSVAADAAQDPTTCPPNAVGLANPSFEEPAGTGPRFVGQGSVPGWSTTADDQLIELWGPGHARANRGHEIDAVSGAQFAELNATQPSMLYQNVETTPGQTLTWRVNHRARDVSSGIDRDTMHVMIGTPGSESPQVPTGGATAEIVDDDAAWGTWTGVYTVPAGQTVTRFGFKAVASSSRAASLGNFLDDITFGTPACVIATKSADTPGPVRAGDEFGYAVNVRNDGGSPAADPMFTDPVPTGTVYVPGSLELNGIPVTDDAGDDAGEYADGTVTVLMDRLEQGGAGTVSFRVRATAETATTLTNTAKVDYRSVLLDEAGTVVSNTVTTPVLEVKPDPTPSDSTDPTPSGSSGTVSPSGSATADPSLPVTGSNLALPLAIGAALLIAGGGIVLLTRIRRG